MYALPYIITGMGALTLVFFLINRDRNGSVPALLLKTLTSFLFICLAFVSFILNFQSEVTWYFMLIIMGLVCGLIGDIVLDLKILYKESSSLYQHAGMAAFFIGHCFYLTALFLYFGFHITPLLAALVLALVIVLVSIFVLRFEFKEHTIDTYMYSIVLSYFMTHAAYAAMKSGFAVSTVMIFAGAVLFLLSDLVLVLTYYDDRDSRPFIAVNHILYYGAQYLIAMSILFFAV